MMPAQGNTALRSLEQIATREGELARSLHGLFPARLTRDDARDAVADAIALTHEKIDELAGLDAEQLERWVRKRAYRNAIDQLRAIDGYGKERRPSNISIDGFSETLASHGWQDAGDAEILAAVADRDDMRSVVLALQRLTTDERRVLHLRYSDSLPVKAIAEMLGIHPKKYERLHTGALRKLRTIFIETASGENCEPVRQLITCARQQHLSSALSAEIAAHVEACAHCRAYEKRSLGLIAALPLPATAGARHCWTRLHELVPAFANHGEGATLGLTGTAAAAGVGGTAASSGVLAGVGAKAVVVLCGGAAVTACVGAIALPPLFVSTPDPTLDRRALVGRPVTGTRVAARKPARAAPSPTRTSTKTASGATQKKPSARRLTTTTPARTQPPAPRNRPGSLTVDTFDETTSPSPARASGATSAAAASRQSSSSAFDDEFGPP